MERCRVDALRRSSVSAPYMVAGLVVPIVSGCSIATGPTDRAAHWPLPTPVAETRTKQSRESPRRGRLAFRLLESRFGRWKTLTRGTVKSYRMVFQHRMAGNICPPAKWTRRGHRSLLGVFLCNAGSLIDRKPHFVYKYLRRACRFYGYRLPVMVVTLIGGFRRH